ncbi:MAG: hypothetical protein ACRD32_06410 [Nitrososphaerales archaeon]
MDAQIKRWYGSPKHRTKAMRGMHNSKTPQIQADGFVIFHSFVKGIEQIEPKQILG